MPLYKNVASQKILFFAWDGDNQEPKTGDSANITIKLSKDGGASATSTNSVSELDATNHPGIYVLALAQAETNCNVLVATASSTTNYIIFRQDDSVFYTVDLSSLATASALTTVDTVVDAIKEKTDNLPADPADQSELESAISTFEINVIDAIGALNDITVAEIIAGIADGDYDLQEMMRIMFSVLAGKLSGASTSEVQFRDSADSKTRVTATVDALGNRTAVTLDGD